MSDPDSPTHGPARTQTGLEELRSRQGRAARPRRYLVHRRGRRIRRDRGAVGMRQIDPAAAHQRHHAAELRDRCSTRAARSTGSISNARWCSSRSRCCRGCRSRPISRWVSRRAVSASPNARSARHLYRQGRTRRLRGSLSARALGRDETARRPGARARGRAEGAADGRAVLRARRPDRDHAARGIARYLAGARYAR